MTEQPTGAAEAMATWTEGSATTIHIGGVDCRVQRPGPVGKRIVREARALHMRAAGQHGDGGDADALQVVELGLRVVGTAIEQCLVWPRLDADECEFLAQMALEEGSELVETVGRFCGILSTVRSVAVYYADGPDGADEPPEIPTEAPNGTAPSTPTPPHS